LAGEYFHRFLFEWRDGGTILMTPADNPNKIYADVVDYWNIDFRGSKSFQQHGEASTL